ncbi:hypothetical protein IGK14_003447 [Enterococcus sp. DIV0970a]
MVDTGLGGLNNSNRPHERKEGKKDRFSFLKKS